MVTDPSMMSAEKRGEFRKQLLEAYQMKQALLLVTDPEKHVNFENTSGVRTNAAATGSGGGEEERVQECPQFGDKC